MIISSCTIIFQPKIVHPTHLFHTAQLFDSEEYVLRLFIIYHEMYRPGQANFDVGSSVQSQYSLSVDVCR